MDEQPQQKKRKWDVPGPATLPQPAHMLVAAGLSSVLGNGVVGTQTASSTPAVDIALAQAAAAALFSKYHPGAQASWSCVRFELWKRKKPFFGAILSLSHIPIGTGLCKLLSTSCECKRKKCFDFTGKATGH